MVKGVESYLDSIDMNLITNGIKYSSDERDSSVNLYTKKMLNSLYFALRIMGWELISKIIKIKFSVCIKPFMSIPIRVV